MKSSKKLKLILQILICILIIMIGIVGIYTKQSNMYKSLLPHKYTLGSDISGITVIELKPDDSEETIYYDADGNEVDSSTVTEENKEEYKSENIPVNSAEILTVDNYKKTIKIMEERLKLLSTNQYRLDLDEETGIISLSVEDDYIDDIQSILPMEGSLKLVDSNTEDVIIDYNNFTSAESTYASLTKEYRTYINLKLNDSGIEKINNIDKYKNAEPVKEDESEEETEETEKKENTLLVMFDSDKIAEVSYDDILLNGKTLRITTGSGLTSNAEINSQMNMDIMASKLATIGKMPVIYNITGNEFAKNDIQNSINYIVITLIAICIIVSLIFIFKYKLKGLLSVLGFVTNISIFLVIIRLTNIQISLNGFAGWFGLVILNMILINNVLKCIKEEDKVFSENIKNAYLKTLDAIIVMLIIFIVFAASSMTVINTMGLLLFWGWIITLLGTLIFTVPMLNMATKN